MARKPVQSPSAAPAAPALSISKEDAKSRLEERIEKGKALRAGQISSSEALENSKREYGKWNSFNIELLKRIFTTDALADEYSRYSGATISMVTMRSPTLGEYISRHTGELDEKIHRLDSIVERLELFPMAASALTAESIQPQPARSAAPSKKVFVVHGHDEVAKTNLEIFLGEIGLEPVVLHRQADEGLTVIEKFEKHSDVGYAFILLTPDEVAYLAADVDKPDAERKKEFRARPNVIFEFGFFVGKLGRSKVCCLYTGSVTLPSDVGGMIYKKFSTSIEEIAYSVIKDLRAAGYAIQ